MSLTVNALTYQVKAGRRGPKKPRWNSSWKQSNSEIGNLVNETLLKPRLNNQSELRIQAKTRGAKFYKCT